jgi:molecular chaperone HscB
MNYFELFGIPVSFTVNQSDIKKTYYRLSREYHPDFFAQADAASQAGALDMSSLVNKAYLTFQDPDRTIRYVLGLKGLVEEEEKYQLDPAFLMEVLEVNEELMEVDPKDGAAVQKIADQAHALTKEEYEKVSPVILNYEEGITPEADLLRVKEYYFRKKYMDRLLEKILNIAT